MSEVPQAPLDEFNRRFCVVCGNRECLRAGLGKLSFDRRAQNWRKDLFDDVPRAPDDDPRFASFRSKRFIVLGSGLAPEVGPPQAPAAVTQAPAVTMETAAVTQAPPAPPAAPPAAGPSRLANTPFVQGTVLPGAPSAPAAEIGSGGTFTFGGDDE